MNEEKRKKCAGENRKAIGKKKKEEWQWTKGIRERKWKRKGWGRNIDRKDKDREKKWKIKKEEKRRGKGRNVERKDKGRKKKWKIRKRRKKEDGDNEWKKGKGNCLRNMQEKGKRKECGKKGQGSKKNRKQRRMVKEDAKMIMKGRGEKEMVREKYKRR